MGTNNKLNNAVAAIHALEYFKDGKNPKKKVVAKVTETPKTDAPKAEAPKAEASKPEATQEQAAQE